DRIDDHRDAEPGCDGGSGLQGAGIRRDHHPTQRLGRERLRRAFRLLAAERGQLRVWDPWVAAGCAEMQVELALSVAQQDHAPGGSGPDGGEQRPAQAVPAPALVVSRPRAPYLTGVSRMGPMGGSGSFPIDLVLFGM